VRGQHSTCSASQACPTALPALFQVQAAAAARRTHLEGPSYGPASSGTTSQLQPTATHSHHAQHADAHIRKRMWRLTTAGTHSERRRQRRQLCQHKPSGGAHRGTPAHSVHTSAAP
jgi:hypothetical protein